MKADVPAGNQPLSLVVRPLEDKTLICSLYSLSLLKSGPNIWVSPSQRLRPVINMVKWCPWNATHLPNFFSSKYLKGGYTNAAQAKPT
jgi:hypothetical protein